MPEQAELEISIRREAEGKYAVEYRFRQPGSQAEVRLGQEKALFARLDLAALHGLAYDPAEYARKLTGDFFADPAGRALFSRARAIAAALKLPLRIRLSLAADAAELHSIYWETLLDPEDEQPLFTGENVSFSRYLSSQDWRPVQLVSRKSLKALVVVANPSDLPDEQTIDAPAEFAHAIQELGSIQAESLGVEADGAYVTLENLAEHLRRLQPDILYLVAHGALSKAEPYLLLEDESGLRDIVPGNQLVARLKELAHPPLLVVLASCQSAGRPGSAEARAALGPRLAEAGVSAVIAMQGDVSQDTIAKFMPAFFRALAKDGRLEYAMSLARGRVRERLDFWMPALFTRLEGETIFAPRVIPWNRYVYSALGVILLALFAGAAWFTTRVIPMGDGFNLAVAEFPVQDERGRFVSTQAGEQFSAELFHTLDLALSNPNTPGTRQIETRPPDQVGIVKGDTPEARAKRARELAGKHNATVLVYGVISQSEQGYLIEIAFEVKNLGFDYGGEVTGPQRLDAPLPIDLENDPFEQNPRLETRLRVLQNIIDGLSFFYTQQYHLAAGYFQEATDDVAWDPAEGKEVAYTLLGAAHLRAYLPGSQDLTALNNARREFESAIGINREYARSYLGLGSVRIQEAEALADQAPEQAAPLLWEAQDWMLTAQNAKDKPETAFVDTKADYGLGLAHLLGSQLGIQGFSTEEARRRFEQVLGDYETIKKPGDLVWHLALARYYLGQLSMETDPKAALEYCQRSKDELVELRRVRQVSLAIAYGWECIGMAQGRLGNPERAASAYHEAINIGQEVVPAEVLEFWRSILEQLEKGV